MTAVTLTQSDTDSICHHYCYNHTGKTVVGDWNTTKISVSNKLVIMGTIFQVTLVHQDSNERVTRQSQSVISWWLNGIKFAITCQLFVIICCLLLQIYCIYIHRKSESNLIDLKQKFRNTSTSSDAVAVGQWFNCKMTYVFRVKLKVYLVRQAYIMIDKLVKLWAQFISQS